jgi:hypothetical protein
VKKNEKKARLPRFDFWVSVLYQTLQDAACEDGPFTVQDRRHKGFFTIDNELLDRYGAVLGPQGLTVYLALARFANQHRSVSPHKARLPSAPDSEDDEAWKKAYWQADDQASRWPPPVFRPHYIA